MQKKAFLVFGSKVHEVSEILHWISNLYNIAFQEKDSYYRGVYFSHTSDKFKVLEIQQNYIASSDTWNEIKFHDYRILIYFNIVSEDRGILIDTYNEIKLLFLRNNVMNIDLLKDYIL